jgi:hypothetical protein
MNFADMIPAAEEAFAKLTPERRAEFDAMLNIGFEEWVMFQEKKSLAQAAGRLDLDNSMWIYNSLGASVEAFNKRSLAVKYVMTEIFKRLLESGAA